MNLSQAHQNPSFGDQIGRYRLIAELARGGMGIVYVAAVQGPAGFNKLVALKELQPELVRDAEFLTMFIEEARMAARLNHANIVQTLDVSEANGRHFIAMEYLEGRSLYQVLRRFAPKGGFPLRLAVTILRDVLNALEYAHEITDADGRRLNFVHRDMSPHNVFVTYDGLAKVIDFGIAKARDSSLETKTGVLKGRTHYMAPEQLTHHADRRTDLFSVGAMLFEMAAGRSLWKGMGEIDILGRLMRGEIPTLQTARNEIPGPIWQICHTALNARPDHRFATAGEMRDALDEYLRQTGGLPRSSEIAEALNAELALERQRTREHIDGALAQLGKGGPRRLEVLAPTEVREPTHRSSPSFNSAALLQQSAVSVAAEAQLSPLPQSSSDKVIGFARRQRLLLAAAALGMVGTAVGVGLHNGSPAPLPAVAPQAAAALRPSVSPMVDTVQLSIAVSPANAQLLLDGEVMPSNPFLGRFPRSSTMHRIRAIAPGYEPRERLVSFADNVILDLSLNTSTRPASREPQQPAARVERLPARHNEPPRAAHPAPSRTAAPVAVRPAPPLPPPASVAPTPAPPPAARPAPSDIAPRSGNEPAHRRSIDSVNPYGD